MPAAPRVWDLFCRVIDNLGDAGFCWRLAAGLATRGERVRLVIDDARPLAFMAPSGCPGVEVLAWPGPAQPGDVVVEAFGCDPPPGFVDAMLARSQGASTSASGSASTQAPVWINLEYLSAEPYVERSHGLRSPQRNGLQKWFFYPGFSARTGGLLREPGLLAQRAAFDRSAWLARQGIATAPGERLVSLFCYTNPALPALLADLAREPTLLLLTPGPAQAQVPEEAQSGPPLPPGLRVHRLPWLSQPDYDRLLWACDVNFVRGEDSLVRALWAGAPLVWQIYPQHDGAHAAKLKALLSLLTRHGAAPAVAAVWHAWNGQAGPGDAAWPGLPALAPWRKSQSRWRAAQLAQDDLVTQLLRFVEARQRCDPEGCC
jgi:uncharacterized repeat protein (TIGR03837 family)